MACLIALSTASLRDGMAPGMTDTVAYDISYTTVGGAIHRVKATRGCGGDLTPPARPSMSWTALSAGPSGEQHPVTQVVNPVGGQMPRTLPQD